MRGAARWKLGYAGLAVPGQVTQLGCCWWLWWPGAHGLEGRTCRSKLTLCALPCSPLLPPCPAPRPLRAASWAPWARCGRAARCRWCSAPTASVMTRTRATACQVGCREGWGFSRGWYLLFPAAALARAEPACRPRLASPPLLGSRGVWGMHGVWRSALHFLLQHLTSTRSLSLLCLQAS